MEEALLEGKTKGAGTFRLGDPELILSCIDDVFFTFLNLTLWIQQVFLSLFKDFLPLPPTVPVRSLGTGLLL